MDEFAIDILIEKVGWGFHFGSKDFWSLYFWFFDPWTLIFLDWCWQIFGGWASALLSINFLIILIDGRCSFIQGWQFFLMLYRFIFIVDFHLQFLILADDLFNGLDDSILFFSVSVVGTVLLIAISKYFEFTFFCFIYFFVELWCACSLSILVIFEFEKKTFSDCIVTCLMGFWFHLGPIFFDCSFLLSLKQIWW